MKKTFTFVVITIIATFFTACSHNSGSGEKITAPKKADSPIYGEWNITKSIELKNANADNTNSFVNNKLQITKEYYILGDYVWDKINLETKIIRADKYFDSLGMDVPPSIVDKSSPIEVYSIIKDKSSMAEITLLSNNVGIIKTFKGTYEISKISSSTEVDLSNKKAPSNDTLSNENNETYSEGILLGLKTSKKDDKGIPSFEYRTLWISTKNDIPETVYQANSIIFPRKNGFWELTEHAIEDSDGNFKENVFTPIETSNNNLSSDTDIRDNEETKNINSDRTSAKLVKEITYISNDFISVNISGNIIEKGIDKPVNKLQIYPVSNLPYEKAVSFKDIFKDTSLKIVNNERDLAVENISGKNIFYLKEDQDKNIGILRKDSHWLFTGRINYLNDKVFSSKDYDISVLPPSNIVYYDNLFMPVEDIESDIDGIIDVFSSPEKKLALILTKDTIYVFNIIEEDSTFRLESNPIKTIKLKENENVIMSEWATNGYVHSWDKLIKTNPKFIKIDE